MKNQCQRLLVFGASLVTSFAFASETPTGSIDADSDLVLAGTLPKLDWSINYPEDINSFINLTPAGLIVPKSDLTMQVRCLAADVQQRREYWNGWRWVVSFNYIQVTGIGRRNSESWRVLFNNTQPHVNPSAIVWQEKFKEDDVIRFGARAHFSGGRWYYSGGGDPNVILLKKGDYPPSYTTWDTQSTLGTHIAPYLDDNGAVDVGPRDIIVAFELTHSLAPGNTGGDAQDMIFLLTFQSNDSE